MKSIHSFTNRGNLSMTKFLSARELAQVAYRFKLRSLEKSNTTYLSEQLKNEIKTMEYDLEHFPETVSAEELESKKNELQILQDKIKSVPTYTDQKSDMLQYANSIFQYVLNKFVPNRHSSEEDKDLSLEIVTESRNNKTKEILVLKWPDGLQLVCLKEYIRIPDGVVFERGIGYRRATEDLYAEADEFVIPEEQKRDIYSARENLLKSVIYPK